MADQFGSQRRQSIIPTFRPAILDCDVLAFEIADLAQTLAKRLENRCRLGWRPCAQPSNHGQCRLLRARYERPRRPTDKCDELASPHSITSSAATSMFCGSVTLSAFAVLRLIANSNFVGCSTGRSAGLAPLRILATNSAVRRCITSWSTP